MHAKVGNQAFFDRFVLVFVLVVVIDFRRPNEEVTISCEVSQTVIFQPPSAVPELRISSFE